MLRVKIRTDNEAFSGDGTAEVVRLLRQIANRIAAGSMGGGVRDINGNTCGSFDLRLGARQGEDTDEDG